MNERDGQNYGILQVVRGDVAPTHFRGRRKRGPRHVTRAELVLDRRMRTRFAAIEGPDGTVPGRAFYAIREAVQHPWRFLARVIVAAYERGVTRQQVKAIMRELDQWVDDLYDGNLASGESRRAA